MIYWMENATNTSGFLEEPKFELTSSQFKIYFEDSIQCGGVNGNVQSANAVAFVGGNFNLKYKGRVERENSGYDRLLIAMSSIDADSPILQYITGSNFTVPEELLIENDNSELGIGPPIPLIVLGSYEDNLKCLMADEPDLYFIADNPNVFFNDTSKVLSVSGFGPAVLEISATTVDGSWHNDAYYEITFSTSGWRVGSIG